MSHLSQIATILTNITSYTIISHPSERIDHGYILLPNPDIPEHNPFLQIESFGLVLKAETLTELETAITAFLGCSSILADGYQFSVAGYPFWIEVSVDKKDWNDTEFYAVLEIIARWNI